MRWEDWHDDVGMPDGLDWETVPDGEVGFAGSIDDLIQSMFEFETSDALITENEAETDDPADIAGLAAPKAGESNVITVLPQRETEEPRRRRSLPLTIAASVALIVGIVAGLFALLGGPAGEVDIASVSENASTQESTPEPAEPEPTAGAVETLSFDLSERDQCSLEASFSAEAQRTAFIIDVDGESYPEATERVRVSVLPPVFPPVDRLPGSATTTLEELMGRPLAPGRSYVTIIEALNEEGALIDCAVSSAFRACEQAPIAWEVPPVATVTTSGLDIEWPELTNFCGPDPEGEYLLIVDGERRETSTNTAITIEGRTDFDDLAVEYCDDSGCVSEPVVAADSCPQDLSALVALYETRPIDLQLHWDLTEAEIERELESGAPSLSLETWQIDAIDSRWAAIEENNQQMLLYRNAITTGGRACLLSLGG